MANIAFDSFVGVAGHGATSLTGNINISVGDNRCAIAAVYQYAGSITSVTLDGVAMTQIQGSDTTISGDANGHLTGWYLIAPHSGVNLAARVIGTGLIGFALATYTSVSQTAPIDASGINARNSAGDITNTITTGIDNDWSVILGCGVYGNPNEGLDRVPTVGTGVTERGDDGFNMIIGDSNGPIHPAGTYNMTLHTVFAGLIAIQVPLTPVSGSTFLLTLLGTI